MFHSEMFFSEILYLWLNHFWHRLSFFTLFAFENLSSFFRRTIKLAVKQVGKQMALGEAKNHDRS